MKQLFILFGVWLIIVNTFALIGANRFNLIGDTAYTWIAPSAELREQTWNPVPLHAQWDSFWYMDISENGYYIRQDNTLSNIVFFPLYPALMSLLGHALGENFALAGWIISLLFLSAALVIFFKLIKEFHPSLEPLTPIFYLLIFPTAFFLNAVYTESAFLFFSLATFYASFKGRFGVAGILGFFASITRVTGVLLFIPVLWEYIRQKGLRATLRPSFIPILFIPLGPILFLLYHKIAFHDLFLFFKLENAWGRTFQFDLGTGALTTHPAIINSLLDGGFILLSIAAIILAFRRKWTSYALYMLASVGIALASGTPMSIGRYVVVLFPMYIVFSSIQSKLFEQIYLAISILFFALYTILFVNGYWAG